MMVADLLPQLYCALAADIFALVVINDHAPQQFCPWDTEALWDQFLSIGQGLECLSRGIPEHSCTCWQQTACVVCPGGEIASTFDNPSAVKLGGAQVIEEIMIGEDRLIHFSGVAMGEACTIVLRGASERPPAPCLHPRRLANEAMRFILA